MNIETSVYCNSLREKDEDDLDEGGNSEVMRSRWTKDIYFYGRAVRVC